MPENVDIQQVINKAIDFLSFSTASLPYSTSLDCTVTKFINLVLIKWCQAVWTLAFVSYILHSVNTYTKHHYSIR